MKRVLLIILHLLVVATCLVGQQVNPSSTALRAIDDYPEGFSYVRRDQSISRSLMLGNANRYHVSAMELPMLSEDVSVRGVSFFQAGDAKRGKVVILEVLDDGIDSESESHFVNAKVVYQEEIAIRRNQATSYQLPTPFVLKGGKRYAVGYEVLSSELTPKVVAYDGISNAVSERYAKLLIDSKTSLATQDNEIRFIAPKESIGAPLIFVELEGVGTQLDNLLLPIAVKLAAEYDAKDPWLAQVSLYNYGLSTVEEVVLEVKINDQTKEYTLKDLNLAPSSLVSKELDLGSHPAGFYQVSVRAKQADGKENYFASFSSPTIQTRVIDLSQYENRKEILVERFSTESCGNCPAYDKTQDEAIEALRKEGYDVEVVVHHAGYTKDWLQLPESKELEPYFYTEGKLHAPAVAFNRVFFPGIHPIFPNDIPQAHETEPFIKKAKEASAIRRAVRIDEITRSAMASDGTYTYTVSVTTTAGVAPGDLYMTALWIESGIPHKKQAGAGPGFTHDHTARKFLTPAKGKALNLSPGKHELKLENVRIPNEEKPQNCRLVVFLHQAVDAPEIGERIVYASKGIDATTSSASDYLMPEDKPYAYAVDGRVAIVGPAEYFTIYQLDGTQVSAQEQLSRGYYVVVAYWRGIPYSSKIYVQ